MGSEPDFLTVEEAAAVLRISRTVAYRLCRLGLETAGAEGIACERVGHLLRVPRAKLEELAGGPIHISTGRPRRRLRIGAGADAQDAEAPASTPTADSRADEATPPVRRATSKRMKPAGPNRSQPTLF